MQSRLVRLGALAAACLGLLWAAVAADVLPAGLPSDLARAAGLRQGRAADAATTFEAIAQRTAELRGLVSLGEVQRTTLTPDELRARLVEELDKAETRESIANSQRLLVALGLLAPNVDLYQIELEFRSGIVLGQYNPDSKQLYVVSGSEGTGQLERVTLAHEYTHALQDQHYDIRKLLPKDSDNSDRDLATSAVLEGDALLLEEIYQAQAMSRAEVDEKRRQERALAGGMRFDRLPLVIVEETYFPYVMGPRFIRSVLGAENVRAAVQTGTGYGPQVHRLFENPPASSAQIIHPEKYLADVRPIEVRFPDLAAALGEGWKQLRKDLLGEIDHRILIQQFANREQGDRAADGWAGDAFALLANGDRTAVVVSSRWDNLAEANEWFIAYAQAMQARYAQQLQTVEQRPSRILWRTPDGLQLLTVDGTSTTILIATSADEIARLEQALGVASVPALRRLLPPLVPAS